MIHARRLTQTFMTRKGKEKVEIKAVAGVDLDVAPGEIVAFLGPNGAGKTTTLRMLTTLLRPSSGEAWVAGHNLRTDPVSVRRNIGYVSQSGSTSQTARAGEEVVDHALLYGMDTAEARWRGQQLFEQLDLSGMWDRQPKAMSGGQRRRLDIVMGLIHNPKLVFLDEPTTGLDPQARANLWTHIRDLREKRGGTVFLTTHYLDEADALADRIIVIDKGTIVAADTSDNLKEQISGDLVVLSVEHPYFIPVAAQRLSNLADGRVEIDGTLVSARVNRAGRAVPELLADLRAADVALESVEVRRPTLDDVFLTLTGRSLRDD